MASLAEALFNLPATRLRGLVKARKMDVKKLALIPNKRHLVQVMAHELSRPASVTDAIKECDARELRLLQLLLSSDGERIVPWQEILDAVGGSSLASAIRGVVSNLEGLGLAFAADSGIYVPQEVKSHVPASLPDRYSLVRCLNNYDAISIKRICENLGVPTDTKGVNIEVIRHALMERGPALRLNRPLDNQEQAVLEFMVQNGGASTAMEVATAVLDGQTDDFFRYDWQNRWKQGKGRNAIDRLLGRGVLHVVSHNYGYNLFVIIPGDLLRVLSGGIDSTFWTAPPSLPEPIVQPPPTIMQHTTLTRDVVTLLGFLAVQNAVRTNTGHIHKTSLKNLTRQLSLTDERYTSFLYALCRTADLIHTTGEKHVYAITDTGNSWLCWDALTQARVLFDSWRTGTLWAEMFTDPLAKAGDYRAKEALAALRQSVIGILIEAGVTGFCEIAAITDTMTFRSPLMLTYNMSLGQSLVPSPGAFVRLLITECLFWLGLAELGWTETPSTSIQSERTVSSSGRSAAGSRGESMPRPPAPEAFAYRLTRLGAHLLGLPAAPPPEETREHQFIIQANAEIFVPPYLAPDTLYHLLTLTETPAKGAVGNTVMLTRESIRRCLDNGEAPRDILIFLQEHARTGIPQNVEYLINEVSAKHGHIHIGTAQMYLQVDSPMLLQELQARRELRPYFVRSLSDTVAVLKADDPDRLLRDLRKTGYLPVSDDAPRVPTLGLNSRPLPIAAPSPDCAPERDVSTAKTSDASLDWSRIASEDNDHWEPALRSQPTGNPVRNPPLVRVLVTQAVKSGTPIQIEYLAQDAPDPALRLVAPLRLTGELLLARDLESHKDDVLEMTRIRWARLCG